jgi:hypothetical protein
MALWRRFLVVAALMFWQGGFVFYAAVVVPVGQRVLETHTRQGFITREVTYYLNLSGAAALVLLAWDAVAGAGAPWQRRLRWVAVIGMAVALVWLVWGRERLDALLDVDTQTILSHSRFRHEHRIYLWVSTVQWALGVLYTVLTLAAWREEDRRAVALRRN